MANILFCVTGPSGSGKTSIMRKVIGNELLSFTTRRKRDSEEEGVDYNFISYQDYIIMLGRQELIEKTEYDGNYYGLSSHELYSKLSKGNAFFVCDNNGFNQIKDKYDKVVSIFLYGSYEDCFQNMKDRGDSIEKIANRLSTYHNEILNKGQYDYVVKNIRGEALATAYIIKMIIDSQIGRMATDESIKLL